MLNIDTDYNSITNLFKTNKLKVPTLPEIALKIRECAEDPKVTSTKLAHVISQDPAMAAKFINIANSPLMRGSISIDSLPTAINRLGLEFVCNVATGLAMEQMFQATNEIVDDILYEVWKSSTQVAAHAHVFAKHFSKVSPDKAALTGLLSHIGVLPILVYAQDYLEIGDNRNTLINAVSENHAKIAQYVLDALQFPKDISAVLSNLDQEIDINFVSLQEVIILALLHVKVKYDFYALNEEIIEKIKNHILNLEDVMQTENFNNDLSASIRFYCH